MKGAASSYTSFILKTAVGSPLIFCKYSFDTKGLLKRGEEHLYKLVHAEITVT